MRIDLRGALALTVIVVTAACGAPTAARTAPSLAATATADASPAISPAAVVPPGELQEIELTQIGNAFSPSRVTVKAGTPVRFLVSNRDPEAHNLVSMDTRYPLPDNQQRSGGTFAVDWVAPKDPGDYWILCAFHPPNMRFRVVVQ